MNELLYGADDERRIVGVHEFGEDEMIIYTRTNADEIKTRRESFRPFMHMTERACEKVQEGFNGIEVHELSGQGVYDRLVTFESFRQFWSARSYLNKHFGQGEIHIIPSMSTQYLTWTGKTLFGGMTMDDIHRMQVDIETYGSQGFPNAERPEDEVIIISFTDNRGLKLILHTSQQVNVEHGFQCRDEQHLLTEFVRTIHRYNPDVLELHNGFGFDLPYLRDRCEMHDVPFALGRDNSKPSTYKSKKKFAEREQEYENFHIAGRNVIDSMFQAVDFDVYYRGLPNYKLKDLAKHFGIAAENRTYVAGDEISWYWDNDPKPLLKYALDDVIETRALVEELGNASFELTKILPFTYQDTLTAGTSGSIEALMAREYVRQGEAIPEADAGSPFGGGYTEMFRRGVYRDLAYADVSSLYPSIMLNYNVKPEADTLDIFKPLLQNLTDMRLETKAEMRAMDDSNPRKGLLNAQQQAYKILINSFYGALGFRFFPWCDFAEAARVTREGRKLLKRLIAVIEEEGGRAISCDSVTEDTPVYIRRDGEIDIVSIAQLHQMGCQEYLFGQRRESNSDIEVLTQSGWSRYSYTYKHETDKEIIQTTTHRGSIKTTKDHSLMMGGEEVRPEDISVGDVLDSYDLELDDGEEGSSDYDIGFFFGAMAGDGSASRRKRYKSGRVRRSVCFHNQDSELINKIRGIVKKEFGFEMNLYDTMKSSGTNRLSKESRGLWEKVGPHLYDEATREKKVPPFVLNGSEEIKKGFLDGYEASDGNRGSSGRVRYTSKSHVLTAGVALLMKSLGMDYIVGCRSDKESVLRLGETPTKYQHEVKKQRYRGKCSNAVYDISTDDGTFVAGVGCITAHNTDGVLFEIPESWEDVDHMIADVISEKMPEGIDIDNDGEFDLVLAYKKKNYVLKPKGSDSLKLKGNSLTGRSIEGVFRQYIREQVHALTSEDLTEARQIHESLKQRIISRAVPIDELRKRGRLKKTLKGYKCGVEEEGKPRLAQYELAFEKWDRTGVKPLSGDLIWYYIAGNKKSYKIRNWRDAKLADDYQGDENINYYLGRLDDVADMFRKMVSHPDYIYSMDTDTAQGGLFGDAAPAELTISNSQIEDTPTGFRYYKPTTP